MELINNSGKIVANYINQFTKAAFSIYQDLNHKNFNDLLNVPNYWKDCLSKILLYHNSQSKLNILNSNINFNLSNTNSVVIAFSGGLDSCYQALKLRELGYNVILLHICNLNKYTNGQEKKVAIEFANKFKFPIELVYFIAKNKDKEWPENTFKTSLCYALCMDYCIEHNILNISSGDDLRLSYKDAVVGVNLGDCKEITIDLFKELPFNYIAVDVQDKVSRLQLLDKYNAKDDYYSCVTANQYLHNKNEEKYHITLDKYSCGNCRKCVMHCLQEYYFLNKDYPQEFIDNCWKRISIGPDEVFFGNHLSLEKRIQNLLDY